MRAGYLHIEHPWQAWNGLHQSAVLLGGSVASLGAVLRPSPVDWLEEITLSYEDTLFLSNRFYIDYSDVKLVHALFFEIWWVMLNGWRAWLFLLFCFVLFWLPIRYNGLGGGVHREVKIKSSTKSLLSDAWLQWSVIFQCSYEGQI